MRDPLVEQIEVFLEAYYKDAISHLAINYPQLKSLYINFFDIDKYTAGLSQKLLDSPDAVLNALNIAARNLVAKEGVFVRITNNPYKVKIGDIRHEHIGKLLSLDGLVLKTTEVRPKLVTAAFQCPFCAHITYLSQTSPKRLTEPTECDQRSGGCGKRVSKFILLAEESTFTDSQKIRLQESLEELRGGDVPRTKDAELEGDLTGLVSPGDRIIVTGILRSEIKVTPAGKSPVFDVFIEANAIDRLEKVFEEIKITEEDEKEIIALSQRPTLYGDLIANIAPSIYGLHEVKEALLLQLFTGVPKTMPDGTTIRGDIHVLLVGDPGLAKCVNGDTEILLADGSLQPIKTLVDGGASQRGLVDDGEYVKTNHNLISLGLDAKATPSKGDLLWKRQATPKMYRILTSSGREIEVTPTHPFFVCGEDAHLEGKKAADLKEGEFIATPRKIDVLGTPQPLNINYTKSRAYNAVRLKLPDYTTPEFWRFIGLFIAEGYLQTKMQRGYLYCHSSFTNTDPQLLDEYQLYAEKMGLHPSRRTPHKGKTAKDITIGGIEFCSLINELCAGELSKDLTVPQLLFKCSKPEIAAFLSALFDGDGTVSADGKIITITSASKKMMSQVQHLLLRFGICSQHHPTWGQATNSSHPKKREYYRLTITGADALAFKSEVGFTVVEKRERLERITDPSYLFNTNVDVIPNISSLLKDLRTKLGLSQFQCGIPRTTYQHYERGDRNPSRAALNIVVREFENRIGRYEKYTTIDLLNTLKTLAISNIFWDKVETIEEFLSVDEYVYDIQVPIYHNFVANDIYVHNSQLLSSVANIAPRGLFTSGSSSTAAGLTAAAVKDEFSEGAWSLEAGALVLADMGLASIDEMDKMSKLDRGALHEAMEQQRVSVAKAGIVASLHSRCALLAAANPIQGRFDPYEPIANQINMPPTLLSRFDLIFIMLDKADDETDSKLAQFVLDTHKRGEAMQQSGEVTAETSTIPPLLLRKYIAYSRKVIPQMSNVALLKFKNFYTGMRQDSRKEDAAIPITVRQLESLIRLGEARARTRLSDTVTEEDADSVLRLFLYCMRSVYTDPESGNLDVDWVVAGTSKTKRDRGKTIREIMVELEKTSGADISALNVVAKAEEEGITREKTEDVLELLKRDGIIFSPTHGIIKFVR